MKIVTNHPYLSSLELPAKRSALRTSDAPRAITFANRLKDARETHAANDPGRIGRGINFNDMTKADYVAWGKAEFAKGGITLDDLFQVQYAGGDFDGSVSTDTRRYDFVAFFDGLLDNEIAAHRALDADSMIHEYRHVLAMMARHAATTDRGQG